MCVQQSVELYFFFGYAWSPDFGRFKFWFIVVSPEWIFAAMQPTLDIDMLRGFHKEKHDTNKSYTSMSRMLKKTIFETEPLPAWRSGD